MLSIDRFKDGYTYYILTHAHTDHSSIPKKLAYPVHCSLYTYTLLHHRYIQLVPTLIAGKFHSQLQVFVFHNHHAPDSIGIFDYITATLYYGEGRIIQPYKLLSNIRICITKAIHDHPTSDINTTQQESADELLKRIYGGKRTIILRNYAQFSLLQLIKQHVFFSIRYCSERQTSVACDIFNRCYDMLEWGNDPDRIHVIVEKGTNGSCSERTDVLIVSAHLPAVCDHQKILVYSSHASLIEIKQLRSEIEYHNKNIKKELHGG